MDEETVGELKGPHDRGTLSRAALQQPRWAREITAQEQRRHEQGQQKSNCQSHLRDKLQIRGKQIYLWERQPPVFEVSVQTK